QRHLAVKGLRAAQQNRSRIEPGIDGRLRAVKLRTARAKNHHAAPVGGQNLCGSLGKILQKFRQLVKTGRFGSECNETGGSRRREPARYGLGGGSTQPSGRFAISLSQDQRGGDAVSG